MIEIQDLTKVFADGASRVTALDNVSLKVETGDIYGIIGMSGAGKSTLLRCLSLLETPTAGRVLLDGQDLAAMTGAALRGGEGRAGCKFTAKRGGKGPVRGFQQRSGRQKRCGVAFRAKAQMSHETKAVKDFNASKGEVLGVAYGKGTGELHNAVRTRA